MKKENSLKFLSSNWLMVVFLALGFMFVGSFNANAQSPFDSKITSMTDLRDTYAPGTAKYDIVQDAVDYLLVLESNHTSNPNYISDLTASTGQHPLAASAIRKAHPTILFNYTAAQLAEIGQKLNEIESGGAALNSTLAQLAQKSQWILEANAY